MATVSTRIDPRLRQRRIAVRRAAARRRLHVLLAVVGALAIATGAYALTRSALLDLDEVAVSGAFGSEAEAVVAATGFELGEPLLDLDLDGAAAAVTDLPWVQQATVERSWPGTVEVAVVRRVPVALLPTGDGGGVVIDAEGIAISRSPTAMVGGLPVITLTADGELGAVQTFALPAIPVVEAMPDDLAPWIETYGIDYQGSETGELVLDLVGGAVAELGLPTDVEAKLDAVRTVLGRVDRACMAVIDVRVAELPEVERDPECEAAAAGGT